VTGDDQPDRPAIHFPAERKLRGSWPVKKGRHRRFEEARALKRSNDLDLTEIFAPADAEPCAECGAEPGDDHAAWCMADSADDD
jgi:hypothetical protein